MNTAAVLLSLLYFVCRSNGLPTVLLPTGPQSEKCFELEAAQDVVLRMFYEAPGKGLVGRPVHVSSRTLS